MRRKRLRSIGRRLEGANREGQFFLGTWMQEGKYGPANLAEGAEWLRRSASQNYVQGLEAYGNALMAGRGVSTNYAEAEECFRKAGLGGSATASFFLGRLKLNGEAIPFDPEGAAWILRAATNNFVPAMTVYGILLCEGRGVKRDQQASMEWFDRAAEAGDAHAQTILAATYFNGLGRPKDVKLGALWLNRAMANNFPGAQALLGKRLWEGKGVQEDKKTAVEILRIAADKGDAPAQFFVGKLLINGSPECPRNEEEGLKLLNKSAALAWPPAVSQVARFLRVGSHGLPKDVGTSVKLTMFAVKLGEISAVSDLGLMLVRGEYLKKDLKAGMVHLRLAAQGGYAPAQSSYGYGLATADIAEMDLIEAYKWNLIADAQGDQTAKENIKFLAPQLSPEQIEEGAKRSRAFKPMRWWLPDFFYTPLLKARMPARIDPDTVVGG
jgi:TPR repeat protein